MTRPAPANPWLAIDGSTPPARRARELRRDWERFLGGARVSAGVRSPVADSWRRSRAAGVDPSGARLAAVGADRAEAVARWQAHPLVDAAPIIRGCLAPTADESEHLIVVSDAAGMLLGVWGNARVRSHAADTMNFTEGVLWTEDSAGTNAIGTALATDHAVQIFATEHFVAPVQAWTCSAAPVHDPETGDVLGVIDVTGLQKNVNPHSLAIVTTAARAVESHLRERRKERDDALLTRFRSQIVGGPDRRALATPRGRLVAGDPRGWLPDARLDLPAGGGELLLPSGDRVVAEPVGDGEAFLVRELRGGRARQDVVQLAEEQAALRRLATAVAQGVPPEAIFQAVADEVGPLLGVDDAAVIRFDADRSATVLAGAGAWLETMPPGARVDLGDSLVTSAVASPITVDGRLWGALVASKRREKLPADIEDRLGSFAELVGVVIANAESRAEIQASRVRVIAADDEARRRIQRDLHDGAQQRLVSTVVALKLAQKAAGSATGPAAELVEEALAHAQAANGDLRELANGILPRALARGGLRAGIEALVSRMHLPVSVEVTPERLPVMLEATAYFIVSEALTNAVKHARAVSARVTAVVDGDVLWLEVRDDGVGGAVADGSGLLGLRDRAAALNGELRVESPPDEGTMVAAMLPFPAVDAA